MPESITQFLRMTYNERASERENPSRHTIKQHDLGLIRNSLGRRAVSFENFFKTYGGCSDKSPDVIRKESR